jgi:hypothetical protein
VAAIVSEGDFDLWLPADAESDAILQYTLRPVEAMKVSHRGSARAARLQRGDPPTSRPADELTRQLRIRARGPGVMDCRW